MSRTTVAVTYGMLLTDIFVVSVSCYLGLVFRFGSFEAADHRETYILVALCLMLYTVLYTMLIGSGHHFLRRGYFVELGYCLRHVVSQAIVWGFGIFFLKMGRDISRLVFGYTLVTELILMFLCHIALKKVLRTVFRGESSKRRVVVVFSCAGNSGSKELSKEMISEIEKNLSYDSFLADVLYFDGDIGALMESLRKMPVDEVLIRLPGQEGRVINEIIMEIISMGVACHYGISIDGLDTRGAKACDYGGYKVLTYDISPKDERLLLIKRLMDICGGIVGIIITAVMYPFLALAIHLDSPGPVVFSQVRIGKNGRRFKIYKFRSMYIDAEERKKELESRNEMKGLMFKMEDDPRVTKVGAFIRKTSLDEFPQFINVLRGEMSLVGTRPPTEDEFNRYTPYYRRRLCMTPGLTGLWQVSGRSEVTDFDDVVKLDLQYIDNWSPALDIKIIFQTVGVVLFGRGAK